MSKWGHPVFTIGATPYDSTNVGHGNYPGGPGFIPGYGYYPGSGPGTYPWMDGPETPFDRRKLAPPEDLIKARPADENLATSSSALIEVRLPADAQLWFENTSTGQTGAYRRFQTPPLSPGRELVYTVQVRWIVNGAELSRIEEVHVAAGGRYIVNFLTTDHWTGRRLETLPVPGQSAR